MKTNASRKSMETTLDLIRKRTSAYDELVDTFGPIFLLGADLQERFSKEIPTPTIDESKMNSEVPLLLEQDLSPWAQYFIQSAESMLPPLMEIFSFSDTVGKELKTFMYDQNNLLGLVQARLEGNRKHFETTSVQLGITPPWALLYIAEMISAPVLAAISGSLDESLFRDSWSANTCPVCGSLPTIAQLSPREQTSLDQLVGGGGKKFLHCSLCHTDWRFKRNACPACGNDDQESREILHVENAGHERIEACHKCGSYCLCIDMRESDPQPNLDAVQIGLIHLDIHAREKNLTPITPTLWNNLEPQE